MDDIEWMGPYSEWEGAEDWVPVAYMDDGGSYEWDEIRFYWSPSARRFFWHHDGGCSCNYWGDTIESAADFESGDRAAALKEVADRGEYLTGADKAADAIRKIDRDNEEN